MSVIRGLAVLRAAYEFERRVAVWTREESLDNDMQKAMAEVAKPFQWHVTEVCTIRDGDLNVHPPMMYFGEASTLGVMSGDSSKPRISFSLDGKPFSDETWFQTQHLVASLFFIGGYGDEEHTLVPPFVPELNEFYSRRMHFQYDKLRSESDRIGLVIDACDKDAFIDALPVNDLIERATRIQRHQALWKYARRFSEQHGTYALSGIARPFC